MGPLAIGAIGLGSLLSGILSNRKKQQTTTSQSTTAPTFDPAFMGLRGQLLRRIQGRIGQGAGMGTVLGNSAIANTNQVFGNLAQASRDRLASAGTGGPGSGVAEASARNIDIGRGSAIVNALNQVPLQQRQIENEDLGMATGLLGMGRGSTTNSTGTTTQPGDLLGGIGAGISDFGSFLGSMYGSGQMGGGGGGVPQLQAGFGNFGNPGNPNGAVPQLQPAYGNPIANSAWHRWLLANQAASGR